MLFTMAVSLCTSRIGKKLSLPHITIQTHPKLLCVIMALPLRISMTNKVMGRKCFFSNPSAKKIYEIVNKQVKFLTFQYVGTCISAYTKGYALN